MSFCILCMKKKNGTDASISPYKEPRSFCATPYYMHIESALSTTFFIDLIDGNLLISRKCL